MSWTIHSALTMPGRMTGIDVARAIALIGMVATHTIPLIDETGTVSPVSHIAGKAAALFAVLAGFSIALSTRKYSNRLLASVALIVRGILIASIGLILGSLGTNIAVILVNYGIMFVLAPTVFRLPTKPLAWLASAWLILTPVLGFWLRQTTGLQRAAEVPDVANFTHLPFFVPAVFLTGYYPVLQWFGYLLVGLLLARVDWSKRRHAWRVLATGVVASAAAWATSTLLLRFGGSAALQEAARTVPPGWWGSVEAATRTGSYGTVPTDTWWWMAVSGPHTSTPFDLIYTAGIAAAVIAACVLTCQWLGERAVWLAPLSAAGSMPLTLYSLHVVLATSTTSFTIHVGVLLIVAIIWRLHTNAPGPLEWVVRHVVAQAVPPPDTSSPVRHGEPVHTTSRK